MTKPNPWVAAGGGGGPQYLAGEISLYSILGLCQKMMSVFIVNCHSAVLVMELTWPGPCVQHLAYWSSTVSRASMAVTVILRAQ